jgi:hypothetical protein
MFFLMLKGVRRQPIIYHSLAAAEPLARMGADQTFQPEPVRK